MVFPFVADISLLQWILFGAGIIFSLIFFSPFLFRLFAPIFFLISELLQHLRESKGQSAGKRYVFIPAMLFAIAGFVAAQMILSIWIFIVSFMLWEYVFGFLIAFLIFAFLSPLAILTAPFIVLLKLGFATFIGASIFFVMALFWFGFHKLIYSEHHWESTPEDFLGYSPYTFLLGALSFQVIALPFYNFGLNAVGNIISDVGGGIFLILTLISALKWRTMKNKLSEKEKVGLYRPPVLVYIFGFILTTLLYGQFENMFDAPTSVLTWLNIFFFFALIMRFISVFKSKKKNAVGGLK